MMGQLKGDPQYIRQYFTEFTTGTWTPIIWSVVFILITHLVVIRGVRRGIEKFSNVLMPMLFILLIVIVIASCTLSGAMDGIRFLFHPDFSKINRSVFLDALGQSFFSLSLGTACLCTYSSYFSRRTKLLNSAAQIAGLDSLIAILAGLMIFPAAFSVGVQPDSGPSLIFITLPNVFQQAFTPTIGYLIAILFYALLALAALTSTIPCTRSARLCFMRSCISRVVMERLSRPAWPVSSAYFAHCRAVLLILPSLARASLISAITLRRMSCW